MGKLSAGLGCETAKGELEKVVHIMLSALADAVQTRGFGTRQKMVSWVKIIYCQLSELPTVQKGRSGCMGPSAALLTKVDHNGFQPPNPQVKSLIECKSLKRHAPKPIWVRKHFASRQGCWKETTIRRNIYNAIQEDMSATRRQILGSIELRLLHDWTRLHLWVLRCRAPTWWSGTHPRTANLGSGLIVHAHHSLLLDELLLVVLDCISRRTMVSHSAILRVVVIVSKLRGWGHSRRSRGSSCCAHRLLTLFVHHLGVMIRRSLLYSVWSPLRILCLDVVGNLPKAWQMTTGQGPRRSLHSTVRLAHSRRSSAVRHAIHSDVIDVLVGRGCDHVRVGNTVHSHALPQVVGHAHLLLS
jgi:hypothetical protein